MGGVSVTLKRWDVCLADVPFEDMDETKIRPIVILEDSALLVECLKMTSQPPRPGEYTLKRWANVGLRKETTVRVSKRLELSKALIIKRLGRLHPLDIIEIEKRIV